MTSELGSGARIPILDQFIETELARIREIKLDPGHPVEYDPLDSFFRKWIVVDE